MENSKFHQLCEAYDQAQINFEAYKTDCHVMSIAIVKELKSYFEIPESQFSLYRIDKTGGFDLVQSAMIHAIQLAADHYWHFGIGLTVCKAPETLPEELILIHLMFRKEKDDTYFIKYANDEKEFEIIKGDPGSFRSFFDFLFEIIMSSYKEHLQQFVGEKTTRTLGFKR